MSEPLSLGKDLCGGTGPEGVDPQSPLRGLVTIRRTLGTRQRDTEKMYWRFSVKRSWVGMLKMLQLQGYGGHRVGQNGRLRVCLGRSYGLPG